MPIIPKSWQSWFTHTSPLRTSPPVIPAQAGIHRARAAVHHAHHSQIMAIMVHPLLPPSQNHVIPAQAGTQRRRASARAAVHHAHHSQIMAIMVHPLPPSAHTPRHSCAGRNPKEKGKGKGGGASCPSFPNHGNHGSPTHLLPLRKTTSFLRRQESTGQGLGGC